MKIKMRRRTMDTSQLVREQLKRLSLKAVVLGTVRSSKKGKEPYKIILGSNNAVYCECDGHKYRSRCRHMDEFRDKVKPQNF